MSQIGVINEIGDMGLGFDLLNENDQKMYDANKNASNSQKEKETKDNSEN